MNLDELYFKDNFTKEDNKTNLEVNKLTIECLESKNNNFSLDEQGNLKVNSISTIAPTPDIISQAGAIYLSSTKTNPSEYLGGIWKQKRTNALFGENVLDKNEEKINSTNHLTFTASEGNAIEYNIEGKSEQESEPSPKNPSEIKTIKGIKNLLNIPDGTYKSNGITAVVKDGIINVSGTANADSFIQIKINNRKRLTGTYTLSSNITPLQNATTTELIRLRDESSILGNQLYLSNSSSQINVENKNLYLFEIRTGNGVTVNYKIKPQLEEGAIAHSYVPYGSWLKCKVNGRNLFDKDITPESYYYNNNGERTEYNDPTNPRLFINQKIEVEKNSQFVIYFKKKYGQDTYVRFCEYKNDGTFIKRTLISTTNYHLTINIETDYIIVSVDKVATYYFENLMIEEGIEATEYDPYKENEVLVDINKPNLINTPYTSENKLTNTATRDDFYVDTDFYAELKAGKTYTFICKTDGVFGTVAGTDTVEGYLLKEKAYSNIIRLRTNPISFTPTEDGKYYLRYDINQNGKTHSFWDFEIYEGYSPYYELCSTEDLSIRDRLEVVSGVLEKRIDKIVLDGTESWQMPNNTYPNLFDLNTNKLDDRMNLGYINNSLCSHFAWKNKDEARNLESYSLYVENSTLRIRICYKNITTLNNFKEYLAEQYASGNPIVIYYELAKPKEIQLTPTDIPLFEDKNHITLEEDIETNTEIKYKPYLSVYVWERVS